MGKKFASIEERRLYYRQLYRVTKIHGKASEHTCDCGEPAKEWAHLHGFSGEDPSHFDAMCRPCHQEYDNRWNEEERGKVSESMKTVWSNMDEAKRDERCEKISKSKMGHEVTQETRAKISESKRGSTYAPRKRKTEQDRVLVSDTERSVMPCE